MASQVPVQGLATNFVYTIVFWDPTNPDYTWVYISVLIGLVLIFGLVFVILYFGAKERVRQQRNISFIDFLTLSEGLASNFSQTGIAGQLS